MRDLLNLPSTYGLCLSIRSPSGGALLSSCPRLNISLVCLSNPMNRCLLLTESASSVIWVSSHEIASCSLPARCTRPCSSKSSLNVSRASIRVSVRVLNTYFPFLWKCLAVRSFFKLNPVLVSFDSSFHLLNIGQDFSIPEYLL